MKKTKDNVIKRWYKLCEPDKKVWFWQIFYYVVYAVFLTVLTIFAARTINCMYKKDWNGAFLNLGIELATIIIRNIAMHLQYHYYAKEYGIIKENITRKIYNKIMSCENEGIKNISKEKIISIGINNLSYNCEFPDAVASFIAYSFQVAITLITVYISNWLAGVIVTLLGVINFFAYYLFNKKLGKIMLERFEKKDDMFKSYNKVIEGKNIIKEFHSEEKYSKQLMTDAENSSDAFSRYYKVNSYKSNLWFIVWNVVVYAVAALMLYYVSNGTMEMTIYLIIVPYLSTCTDKLNTLFDKTSALENMRVDCDRMYMILNMTDSQLIKYGDLNVQSQGYNLGIIDVSYSDKQSKMELKNVDISFKMEDVNIIRGDRDSGKRLVFNLLRRSIQPKKGTILLDNLNLYDYNEKTFKSHINYCASHPPFISGTVKENLMISEKRFDRVRKLCDKVGVLSDIDNLPGGFNCQIIDITSSETLFLLGLVRALLTSSKILMIYEIPQNVSEEFKVHFSWLLTKLAKEKTIIFFTHSAEFDHVASLVYEIKNGSAEIVRENQIKANVVSVSDEIEGK